MVPDMNPEKAAVLTVSELTQAIKLNLERLFPFITLQGEISNFKLQTSGHLYFSLKDANAQISVVMFRTAAAGLKSMPKAGDHVVVKGEITVYPSKGNYQLIVRELSYVGIGELLQKLEQLKIKLHQKGYFKSIHKKPLPLFPKRIGVVTSPTGAVIQDILNVLSRRYSGFQLILNPVKVQGEGAAQEIAQAIDQFNQYDSVDVMIVGRGGGSLEDLWAFNEECVADAIFRSRIPIISAVGHETDHCIADYVADVRAPTPSAAAEIVIAEKLQQLERLNTFRKQMRQTLKLIVQNNRYRLQRIVHQPFFANPRHRIEQLMQKLDDVKWDIDNNIQQLLIKNRHRFELLQRKILMFNPQTQIAQFKTKISYWKKTFDQKMQHQLTMRVTKLQHMHLILKAIDPKQLLQKGYTILFSEKENSVITSIKKLEKGQKARLLLSDGSALITINDLQANESI